MSQDELNKAFNLPEGMDIEHIVFVDIKGRYCIRYKEKD